MFQLQKEKKKDMVLQQKNQFTKTFVEGCYSCRQRGNQEK
jgi:hypothetical protein